MEYKVKQTNFKHIKSKAPEKPVVVVESYEDGAKEEIEAITSLFKRKSGDERSLKEKNTSTGYWFAVYFADEDQKNEFIKNSGLEKKMDSQYVNGEVFAKVVGVELTKKKIETPKAFRRNKGFDKILM